MGRWGGKVGGEVRGWGGEVGGWAGEVGEWEKEVGGSGMRWEWSGEVRDERCVVGEVGGCGGGWEAMF